MTEINSGTGPSPFEGTRPTRSRRVFRITVSLAVVAIAILAAVMLTRGTPDASATAGHNHVAPVADSAVPVALHADGARRIGVTFAAVTSGPMTTDIRSLGQVTS
jgi:hypothetical protein